MEQQNIKILAAPAHYQLNSMSEYGWANTIIQETAKNYPVHFYTITGFDVLKNQNNKVVTEEVFMNHIPQPGTKEKIQFILKYYKKAVKILKKEHIDIIHHILPFGWKETFNLLPIFGKTKNIPFIVGPVQTPHSFIGKDCNEGVSTGIISQISEKLNKKTLEKADVIVAITEEAKNLYQKEYPSKKVIKIPPGIYTNAFTYKEKKQEETTRLLVVGALIERKNNTMLLNIIKNLKDAGENIHLYIVGDGPQKTTLQKQSKEQNTENKITFTGKIPHSEVEKYFRRCDIYCSTSKSESFGQVYLEAMATGIPVISTKNIGANEIIKDNSTGYLIKSGDEANFTEKIQKLINDKNLYKTFSINGRKRVEEVFDWEVIIPQYYKIYKEILKK